MSERLQKILARHGLGSRREIERFIAEGRVTINREVAQVGAQYRPGDRIAIDGKEVTARLSIDVEPQVLLFHKAQGQPIDRETGRTRTKPTEEGEAIEQEPVEHSSDSEPVLDRVPAIRGSRWVPINPMHPGDSGLLLLTNDGNLGYALTRQKRWIPTAYMVRVLVPQEADALERYVPEIPLQVTYDNGRGNETVEFTNVEPAGGEGANLWYRVELARADRRAAVRALFESRNLKVSRMTQVAFGSIELPRDLPRGRHRALSADQVTALYALAKLEAPAKDAKPESEFRPKPRKRIAPDRRRSTKPHRAASRERSSAAETDRDSRSPRRSSDKTRTDTRFKSRERGASSTRPGATRDPKRPNRRSRR